MAVRRAANTVRGPGNAPRGSAYLVRPPANVLRRPARVVRRTAYAVRRSAYVVLSAAYTVRGRCTGYSLSHFPMCRAPSARVPRGARTARSPRPGRRAGSCVRQVLQNGLSVFRSGSRFLLFFSNGGCGSCGKRRRVLAGVFQVLWEGAASSRLSTGRQLP
jgi:hypothetical protein